MEIRQRQVLQSENRSFVGMGMSRTFSSRAEPSFSASFVSEPSRADNLHQNLERVEQNVEPNRARLSANFWVS